MQSNRIQEIIHSHWGLSNERAWGAFEKLLHPELLYECPQTREYITGSFGYLEMFRTWPGDWQAKIQKLICSEDEAVSVINFEVGPEVMLGISFFEFKEGLIVKVTDYWPEEYVPPIRATPHLKRRGEV